ncbi:MAG: hypothetical protein HYX76_15290 [Acidobacteria bacterium]|nr:hypothetical protein [Acidobacteriota bacterium]
MFHVGASRLACVVVLYAVLAVGFTWPLARHLGDRITGPRSSDAGVYVWNLWVFRHEVIAHGRMPWFTNEILTLSPPVDLSLHNYTPAADMVAFPLIPSVGVVRSFNLLYLASFCLTATMTFLLVYKVTGATIESALAGAAFAASPFLIARGMMHFSLAAAAALPAFLLAVVHIERRTESWKPYFAAGATAAWAALSDPYYGVYCALLALGWFASHHLRFSSTRPRAAAPVWVRRILEVSIGCSAAIVAGILLTGGTSVEIARLTIGLRSLYTPMLLLCVFTALRFIASHPMSVRLIGKVGLADLRLTTIAAFVCLVLLVPVLYALSYRILDGGTFHSPIRWCHSPPGVDVLAFFTPNPNHPLFGSFSRAWLERRHGGFVENVAALPLVALVTIAVAWKRRFRPDRPWMLMTILFALLAIGPFLHIAGMNTRIPGPWAFLRYVPLIGWARMPTRFAVLVSLGISVLFGLALVHLTSAAHHRRRTILWTAGVALFVELLPAPRPLYSATLPAIYRTIAADRRNITVLEVPLGIRDGESTEGDFNTASQFFRTFHEKRIIGGYLSRITRRERRRQREFPTIRALLHLSEGKALDPATRASVIETFAPRLMNRAHIAYVVVDTRRATPELRAFAIEAFGLERLGESDGRELFRTACQTCSTGGSEAAGKPGGRR